MNRNFLNTFITTLTSCAVLFCLALLANLDPRALWIVCPLGGLAMYAGWSRPAVFLDCFFLFLPLFGFLNIFLVLPALPVFMPVLWAGLLGRLMKNGADLPARLPKAVTIYIAGAVLSAFVAVIHFLPYFPHFSAVVARNPWGLVYLKNALGWIGLALLGAMSGVALYYWIIGDRVDVARLLDWLLLGMVGAFILGVFQNRGVPVSGFSSFYLWGYYQCNATFRDPNTLGLACAMLIPLWFARTGEENFRVLRYLGGPMLLFLIVISGVRSAYLALGIGFVVLACRLLISGSTDLKRRLAVVFFILVILGFYQYKREPNSRLSMLLRDAHRDGWHSFSREALGDRPDLWRAGWVTAKHNPVLGVGLGTYLIRMPSYGSELKRVTNDNSANMYLHVVAEQGVVGLSIFLFLIGFFCVRVLKVGILHVPFLTAAAFSSLVGICIAFLFGAHLLSFEVDILFWFLLAAIQNGVVHA